MSRQISSAREDTAARATDWRALLVLILCLAAVTLDGFDAQVMAYVSPKMMTAWSLDRALFTPALSAGLFGLMIGAPLLGMQGDRIGRKSVLLISVAWFGAFSLMTVSAASIGQLVVLRFLTGLGLGGAMPAAIALVSEHAPPPRRGLFVTITVCGFAIGPALGGLIAAPLLGSWGWGALFVVGGVLPLALVPALWRWVPNAGSGRPAPGPIPTASPRVALFAEGRSIGTPLLWLAIFLNLLAINLIVSWLPIVIMDRGFDFAQASIATSMFHVGGVVGGLAISTLVDRFGYYTVGTLVLACACAAVTAIGSVGGSIVALRTIVLIAGLFTVGGQALLNALSGMFYPAAMRSTGSGWALGIGRLGAAIGPLIGGMLMARHFDHETLFVIEAAPLIAAAMACAGIGWSVRRSHRRG